MEKSPMIDLKIDENDNYDLDFSDGNSVEMDAEDIQEKVVTEYNFGDGLIYDPDTNNLSVDIANSIEEGNESLVRSKDVYKVISEATYNSGAVYADEEITVGRFGDKALYQRMLTFNNMTLSNIRTHGFVHNVPDIDEAFVSEAYFKDTALTRSNGAWMNATGGANTLGKTIPFQWFADNTYIWINSDTFFNASTSRTWRIVLRYTKVGD